MITEVIPMTPAKWLKVYRAVYVLRFWAWQQRVGADYLNLKVIWPDIVMFVQSP